MDMETVLQTRVTAGVRYLNDNPENRDEIRDWPKKIVIEDLDLGTGCNCVFGQLFGHYEDATDTLGLKRADAIELGLYVDLDEAMGWDVYVYDVYDALTGLWADKIKELQAVPV